MAAGNARGKGASSKAAPKKRAAMRPAQLHELIRELIDARQRGDHAADSKAAAEARAVAGHAAMVDSLRLPGDIAARPRHAA